MALSPEQLQRLQTRFDGLCVSASCTLIDSWFGAAVHLGEHAEIHHSKIGAGSSVGAQCTLQNVDLGRSCSIGPHCRIGEPTSDRETRIGDDVHIGAHCRIHPGVTIGRGATVPDHATVDIDLPPNPNAQRRPPLIDSDPDHALPLKAFLLEKTPLVHMFRKWCADHGDETLRVEYPLAPGSIVVDVGGYHGDWAAEMVRRYGATVHVFEPVHAFAEGIAKRFAGEERVRLHRAGLAGSTRQERISLASEGSSLIKQDEGTSLETIELVAGAEALRRIEGDIAVLKINIEGAEYELLDHLLDKGLLNRVRHLQVQFHEFTPDARPRRRAIRSRLRATHVERWNYPFLWEGWERQEPAA